MFARIHVLVFLVASVSRPSVQQKQQDWLYEVAEECLNSIDEDAAVDVVNIVHQVSMCTRAENLYEEAMKSMISGGMKEAVTTVCRRKDELLTCLDQAFETIKRCFVDGQKKQALTLMQATVQPSMDFVCEHGDDLAAIFASPEEQQCMMYLAERAEKCDPSHNINDINQLLDTFKSLEHTCKKLTGTMACMNAFTGNCKNSISLRFFNDMVNKVLGNTFCLKKIEFYE